MKTLENKVAVITGASRGLGKAIAIIFAYEGAKVVLAARSKDDIEQNAAALRAEGYEAAAYACDVSDPVQMEGLANFALQTYGHFDVWVNNAGASGPYGNTFDLSPEQFMQVLKTNIDGVYYGSRQAMRHFLLRKSGKLINILGRGSKKPAPNQNAYGSSKAWMRVFTLALAKEYKKSGVGVYALQPGMMDTDLLSDITTFEDNEKSLRAIMPWLIRAGAKKPVVPAARALWLASSATDGKTGLEVNLGSTFSLLRGFLVEGVRRLLHLKSRPLDMHVTIVPSAFEALEEAASNSATETNK